MPTSPAQSGPQAARDQRLRGFVAGLLGAVGIDLQGRVHAESGFTQRAIAAAVTGEEFREVGGCIAEERDLAPPALDEVAPDQCTARGVVATDRDAGLSLQHRAPAHEMRALRDQVRQLALVGDVVAVAEQDQAIGLHAVLVVGMPVVRQLLEGHQQVMPMLGAGAGDRTEHRQEERIDVRVVRGRILEQQQRQGAGALGAQAGGVAIDLVVQLANRFLDALAGLDVHQRATAQHARDRGLRHPGSMGDVHRGGLGLLPGAARFLHRSSVAIARRTKKSRP